MILVSDTAAAAGVASVPGPVTDIEDEWFVYLSFAFQARANTAVGYIPDFAHRIPFESKAKRIIGAGRTIVVVCENAYATHAFDIQFSARLLGQV